MKTLIQISVILLMASISAHGQSLRAYEKKTRAAHRAKDFPAALAYEKILLEIDSQRLDARFRGGQAALKIKAYGEAARLLSPIPDSLRTGDFAATDFHLGCAQKGMGRYREAIYFFQKYIDGANEKERSRKEEAAQFLDECAWMAEQMRSPIDVEIRQLGENVNTVSSDFAPLRFAEKLYFTTAHIVDSSEAPVMRIFAAVKNEPPRLAEVNIIDPARHAAQISITANGKRAYFTICENREKGQGYQCKVFYRNLNYEGDWSAAVALPGHINRDSFTTTQPSVGYDRFLKKEVLYFASDRTGGQGGLDVWASEIKRDNVGEIVAFGEPYLLPFNTPEDDVTPFFHHQSQRLYFSSAGHRGMGGLDVFFSEKNEEGEWAAPQNLGYPLNSSRDELYYTYHSGSARAYFASNRAGATCAEPEKGCACNDIYEASFRAQLDVLVWNDVDISPLKKARVELLDMESGQLDTFWTNPMGNKFSFPLEMGRNYKVIATLDGFSTEAVEVGTDKLSSFTKFERNLFLKPSANVVVRTFNATDGTPLNGAVVSLSSGLRQKTETGTNTAVFPLDFGKKYDITAFVPGFEKKVGSLSTVNMNQPGTLNLDLYLSPTFELPLTLYFDNDQPRYVEWLDTATVLTYGETFADYMERTPAFFQNYTAHLTPVDSVKASEEVAAFFQKEVAPNFTQLQIFCGQVFGQLETGQRLEVFVDGHASPLAEAGYNERLTSRRISSLENHFAAYKGGVLAPYILSGKLKIRRTSHGETKTRGTASDVSGDYRNAVYSPSASRLRRVTITELRVLEKGDEG